MDYPPPTTLRQLLRGHTTCGHQPTPLVAHLGRESHVQSRDPSKLTLTGQPIPLSLGQAKHS